MGSRVVVVNNRTLIHKEETHRMSKGGHTTNLLMLQKSGALREHAALAEAFKRADVDCKGRLTAEAYKKIIRDHSLGLSNAEIAHLVDIADKNHDGFISFEEFVGGSERRRREAKSKGRRSAPIDRTEAAFNVFDSDKDGYVTKQEFLRNTSKLSDEQVRTLFERLDMDGDGKLNKEEFDKLMAKAKK